MRRLILLCIALPLAWPDGAPAQMPHQLVPGTRVRITESGSGVSATYAGTLVTVAGDTVVLQPEHRADTLRIPIAWVSILDVSRGRKSRIGAGIGYGALAGVATGALVGFIACGEVSACRGSSGNGSVTFVVVVGSAVLGVVAGSVVGGVIGTALSGEHWQQVPPERWHLSVTPRPHGGVALAVSVRF